MELVVALHILGRAESLFGGRDRAWAKPNTLRTTRKAVGRLPPSTDYRAPILRCWKPRNFADRSVVGRVGRTLQVDLVTEISTHVLRLEAGKKMFKLPLWLVFAHMFYPDGGLNDLAGTFAPEAEAFASSKGMLEPCSGIGLVSRDHSSSSSSSSLSWISSSSSSSSSFSLSLLEVRLTGI